ncbi:hypothetical protein SAMN05660690_3190 [Geodermatophilus telluris]|uniref:Uncharacterized protein n=1 Tax=Geodermatophilus telluris TaxID=1190417 RepID=A0A1G6R127_9ACTN|nr:hypothetical protein [Geodermatophilus telluris]SDC98339.1 hypothetical protein SAMN05660690_3190 [Geodermatophilus telluris]
MPQPVVPARAVPAAPSSPAAGFRHPVALLRWLWLAYMTPGRPGRPTGQTELRWIYTAWLGAFLLKMLGSSWDVSWHFKWLRDDLAPPHLLNSAGTAVVVALVVFHSYSGYGVDRRALRLMQWGIGTFLVAVPVDIVNHRVNGLDITSWSPSHALLYLGTAVMLAGAVRGWWLYAAPGRVRDLVSLGLWLFFVENVLFPNQHQEYGVLSLRAYEAGRTTAEPQLLDFAVAQGQTPTTFMLPVPSWVHPAWLVCAGLLSLVVARRVVGLRWTATAIAGAYLAYRAVVWAGLVALDFPPSVLPFVLLVGAVCVDLAVTSRVPGWAAAPVTAAAVYAAGTLQEHTGLLPPWDLGLWSTGLVVVGFTVLWTGVDMVARSSSFARWSQPLEPGRPEDDGTAAPSAPGGASPRRGAGPDRHMS